MKRLISLLLCAVMIFGLCACSAGAPKTDTAAGAGTAQEDAGDVSAVASPPAEEEERDEATEDGRPEGTIYLYGEYHADPYCMWQELEAWGKLYEKGARHLFIEYSYATAQMLNAWDPSVSNRPFAPLGGAFAGEEPDGEDADYDPQLWFWFFKTIREKYPETVLHGTDIEHQFDTIGAGYLAYLESLGMRESEEYARTLRSCEQGRTVYEENQSLMRESFMTENFIYELDRLETQDIMGVYGAAHTEPGAAAYATTDVPNMATQLCERYGERVETIRLERGIDDSADTRPEPIGTITVNGRSYETAYVAQRRLGSWDECPYEKVVYWRLKDSWDDFADSPAVGELNRFLLSDWSHLVYYSVYFADCTKHDGSVERIYFRTAHAEEYKGFIPVIEVEESTDYGFSGTISLLGERHAVHEMKEQELEAWGEMYEKGARHLFVECGYAAAQLLNLWMHSDDDGILDRIYADSEGSRFHSLFTLQFYRTIKERYPETVLHGVDVEYWYDTAGARLLEYLESTGQKSGVEYARTLQSCEQGRRAASEPENGDYRENCMVRSFLRELKGLGEQDVMGIFGSSHVEPGGLAYGSDSTGNMASQLAACFGERVVTTLLSGTGSEGADSRPEPIGTLKVNGRSYETAYVSQHDLSMWAGLPYKKVVYWRLKNSYGDFARSPVSGELDPFLAACDWNSFVYESVYVADCTRWDGTVERLFFRTRFADKNKGGGIPCIEVEEG